MDTLTDMKQRRRDIFAISTIIVVIILFFLPLFWPVQQLLVTPDFGKSDSWHFSFATKYFLWESFHQNKLPLWTDKLGDGFPIFAEGQVGTFFLPNLILFRLINDPVLAYNLTLVVTVIILATGMYVWLRTLRLSILPSLFGSVTFTFSGIVILQLPHLTLLQGFSLLPWIMAIESPIARAILLSQQIFTGFPQATFLTLLLTGSWALYQKKIARLILSILLGFTLSAVQLVPSWEFAKEAGLRGGLSPEIASYFSFPLVHLKSFFAPFALGDPKMGTYPHFSEFDGSIFWENTGYIGLLPLLLILVAIRFRSGLTSYYLIILLSSFFLMWGSHSPFYIIYSLWPFNLFRVPSRFLWIFVFSLTTLATYGAQTIRKKNHLAIFFLLAVINTTQLFFLWRNYHLLMPAREWLEKPMTASLIPDNGSVITVGAEKSHNDVFLTSGWQDPSVYQTLRLALAPDSNIIWGVRQNGVYAGRSLRRPSILDSLLPENQKLLDLMGVTHIISTVPVDKPVIYDQSFIKLSVNTTAIPRSYVAQDIREVRTVEQAITELTKDSFVPGKTVLVEKSLNLKQNESLKVFSDTYYPGWNAYVDGKQTEIIPANIRYRAIVVPDGDRDIEFVYQPKSFRLGLIVTAFAALLVLLQIGQKALLRLVRLRTPFAHGPDRA